MMGMSPGGRREVAGDAGGDDRERPDRKGPPPRPLDGHVLEGEALEELRGAIDYFSYQLQAGLAYEVVQASLHVFLRIHQERLSSTAALQPALQRLQGIQETSWGTLKGELHRSLCLLSHFCRTQS